MRSELIPATRALSGGRIELSSQSTKPDGKSSTKIGPTPGPPTRTRVPLANAMPCSFKICIMLTINYLQHNPGKNRARNTALIYAPWSNTANHSAIHPTTIVFTNAPPHTPAVFSTAGAERRRNVPAAGRRSGFRWHRWPRKPNLPAFALPRIWTKVWLSPVPTSESAQVSTNPMRDVEERAAWRLTGFFQGQNGTAARVPSTAGALSVQLLNIIALLC
jgi:hypothetical protein